MSEEIGKELRTEISTETSTENEQPGDIVGEKIILRPMTLADTDLIVTWRNKEIVRKNFIYQKPFTPEGHREWFRTMIDTGKAKQFIVCEKIAGSQAVRPIGSAYLRDIDYEFSKVEFGMYIGEQDAHNKGYGTEITTLITDYAFNVLKLHKVYSRIFADNIPSIKSCLKNHFIKEAYLKDEVKLDGLYRDIVLVALFDDTKG